MQIIKWEIQFLSPPPASKYCKRCGQKIEHLCSGSFRVNAQRNYLDIWLIYKCSSCDYTWNMTIFSRIHPQSIAPEVLEGFHRNQGQLVRKYAMDTELIRRNGAEAGLPKYIILGPVFDFTIPVELHIVSPYPSRLKAVALLREKLHLSQNAFEQMVINGSIRSARGVDLVKCRLLGEVILLIDSQPAYVQERNRKQCPK